MGCKFPVATEDEVMELLKSWNPCTSSRHGTHGISGQHACIPAVPCRKWSTMQSAQYCGDFWRIKRGREKSRVGDWFEKKLLESTQEFLKVRCPTNRPYQFICDLHGPHHRFYNNWIFRGRDEKTKCEIDKDDKCKAKIFVSLASILKPVWKGLQEWQV